MRAVILTAMKANGRRLMDQVILTCPWFMQSISCRLQAYSHASQCAVHSLLPALELNPCALALYFITNIRCYYPVWQPCTLRGGL